MSAERKQKARRIYEAALRRAPGERLSFVVVECAGDEALRREVEALLAAQARHDNARETKDEFGAEMIGRRVGQYRIVREIGRGGMGAVYLATRADDMFQKRVAVKLIKRGMDTELVLRRFRRERQILASLDHPNIAYLLDGGTTDDGLPYFVMEYIEGQHILRYSDARRLSTPERLRLYLRVCEAVQYAHQNLVIHRDLKPTNVLVTPEGTPKLLDFGIAKLLNPAMGAQTLDPTTLAVRLMTPEYASPEQVRGEPVTVTSDVYSLGVLLYELLTGHRPYRLRAYHPAELIRVICEEEPERPSAVIDTVEVAPDDASPASRITPDSVSRVRDGSPDELRRQLMGSLDLVVLKALRKEPQRRYQSVEMFGEDIRRCLDGQPVSVSAQEVFAMPSARRERDAADTTGKPQTIAVLPFKMLGVGSNQERQIELGIVDAIITRLGNVRQVVVRPTSSVVKYAGDEDHPPLTAGRELNADLVLDGRIQQVGEHVRVTVQLLRVADGTSLWAAKFDEDFTDIFALEDAVSEKVAGALIKRLTGADSESHDEQAADAGTRAHAGGDTSDRSASRTISDDRHVFAARTRTAFANRKGAVFVAALALVMLTAFGLYRFSMRRAATVPFRAAQIAKLTTTGNAVTAAVSPDGKYVAYAIEEGGRQSLWVRQVAVANSVRIVPPAATEYRGLTFSRDGTYIYYVAADQSGGVLFQVPALGGSARRIAIGVDSPVGLSPDGEQLTFVRRDVSTGEDLLLILNEAGGEPKRLTARRAPERLSVSSAPAWSPDGAMIAFVIEASDANGFHMRAVGVRIEDERESPLSPRRWLDIGQMRWLPAGEALVAAAQEENSSFTQLWHLPYPQGEARRITDDLSDYRGVSLSADAGALVTVQRQTLTSVWIAPPSDPSRPTQITTGAGRYFDLSWTPDGKIVYASDASGSADIWEMEADGTEQRQLTAGAGRNYAPVVSPDNAYIVFHSNRSGNWQIWRMRRDGGDPIQLTTGKEDSNWAQISPDGRRVVFERTGEGAPVTLWTIPIEGGTPTRLTDKLAMRPAISPDGTRVAYWQRGDAPDAPWRIAIASFSDAPPLSTLDTPQSPTNGATSLRWTRDGRAIMYLDYREGTTRLWRQPLDSSQPVKLLESANNVLIHSFDFSIDDRLILARGLRINDVVLINAGDSTGRTR